ncbi:thioredoxin [Tenacibaculum holothuriorum]|uniref:Thioredoxin n=1 Tax=Tenacibaculum holothuriorum TaxID=1635173 RepID=A0A1Y2P941_9FLAO|nr:TlpA disulfide reductase family protein [Tenacibaculum holothuriorum]OSY86965.1 thioredoxin [Tenacibaculum holothuriorum]
MKKILYAAVASLAIIACKNEPKDYVTLSGKITNMNSDSLVVVNPQTRYKKVLKLDEQGTFSDTLKVKPGVFILFDGTEQTQVFLKNGADINVTLDTKEFDETVTFTGSGVAESNFLKKSALVQEEFFKDLNGLLTSPKEEYEAKMKELSDDYNKRLTGDLDSAFVSNQKKSIEMMQMQLGKMREQKMYLATKLAKGTPSPKFENYENHKGGTTSLDDLKGKYVYVDVWATWCQPCKNEIPSLKKVEKQFHDKNIEFVSISVDKKNAHEAWKKMVADKELGGVQLFADNDWNSKFVKDYLINGIPRFILIDPNGNIVTPDAPRPSNPKLVELFNSLDI